MTLRVFRWSMLFSALFFCSCITVDKTLGDSFIPADQDLTIDCIVFDLPVSSRPSDSLPTNSFVFSQAYSLLFGSCLDPVFGATETGSVFQFIPYKPDSTAAKSYGDNPQPVSLTLKILCGTTPTVLDNTQASIPQHLYVHEILSDLSFANAYNNSLLPEHWDPKPISQPGQLYFGTDTATISLSLDFARELLRANEKERDSIDAFIKHYKGLYIRTEQATSPYGGRLNQGFSASLTLRYTASGADSTLTYNFYSYGYNYNTVSHAGASLDPHPSRHIYFQGLAGPKPYIDFAALAGNIRNWAQQEQIDPKKLLIVNAEAVLSYSPSIPNETIDQYPPALALSSRVHADSLTYYRFIADARYEYAGGNINRSKFQYAFNITHYLQSMLKKDQVEEQDNAWLMTVDAVEDSYAQTVEYYVNNAAYQQAVFEGTATNAKPVVKITYAVLK